MIGPSVGRPSAYEAVRRVRIARELGAREFAALTPYYLASTQDSLYDYFAAVAEAVGDGELFIYIYPKLSGNSVSPELLARLAGALALGFGEVGVALARHEGDADPQRQRQLGDARGEGWRLVLRVEVVDDAGALGLPALVEPGGAAGGDERCDQQGGEGFAVHGGPFGVRPVRPSV